MTVLSYQTLNNLRPIYPWHPKTVVNGKSFGLSHAGYDVRIAQNVTLFPGEFSLASTIEEFRLPTNIQAIVHDKSSWARQGLSVFNTVLEPGWQGYLTLELANHGKECLTIIPEDPIAQIVFHFLDHETDFPYVGKYQNQGPTPQPAIFEKE